MTTESAHRAAVAAIDSLNAEAERVVRCSLYDAARTGSPLRLARTTRVRAAARARMSKRLRQFVRFGTYYTGRAKS